MSAHTPLPSFMKHNSIVHVFQWISYRWLANDILTSFPDREWVRYNYGVYFIRLFILVHIHKDIAIVHKANFFSSQKCCRYSSRLWPECHTSIMFQPDMEKSWVVNMTTTSTEIGTIVCSFCVNKILNNADIIWSRCLEGPNTSCGWSKGYHFMRREKCGINKLVFNFTAACGWKWSLMENSILSYSQIL